MTKPCIICVAITGSVPRTADNPAVPVTIEQQIESTQAAHEAGAAICHAHVRDENETPTSDPDRFARLMEGLRRHCPDMIIQLSTGGRSGAGKERGGMLPLRPEMASLSVGSNNFPTRVYENPPDLVDWLAAEMRHHDVMPEIEAFDLSHIFKAAEMNGDGRIRGNAYVQFVMGVKNAMPADSRVFDIYVETMARLLPNSEWCAAGIGRHQLEVNEWSVSAGGHARTGLEDNIRLDPQTLAPSNAALVQRTVEVCRKYDRPVATPREARQLLGLPG
ncbi:3-keto-5-aminohexanoate cleavage protein [Roseisalinus antarcticus]|uniref:3-keto-5-aminohexanoate cleavage enzyme n=1 Tax=Roseisalinus antarcticus TaxID=254357 RepID=A0A1Y5T3J6_9RHOB|nr:3-keto-5-aminohexanoate cleavage protein [Roseisalinus antarcticus]SLN53222.1 3-keto-5-aminohexanoate cleavage enzyme [Roseisalinus antarcticus]